MKARKEGKYEEKDHEEGEQHVDNKNAAILPIKAEEQALFDENVSSEWMKSKRIPVDYSDKILELQFTAVSAFLQVYILPKNFVRVCFYCSGRQVLWQRSLHGFNCFRASFAPHEGQKFVTSRNR